MVATAKARHFFDPSHLTVKCHFDEDEWVCGVCVCVCVCVCMCMCVCVCV